jgi:hypothetical protein
MHDTVPNALLSDSSSGKSFRPAYLLSDGRFERAGRTKNANNNMETNSVSSNGMNTIEGEQMASCSASIIIIGDEILLVFSSTYYSGFICVTLIVVWNIVFHGSDGSCDAFLFLVLNIANFIVYTINIVWKLQSELLKDSPTVPESAIHLLSIN